MPSVRFLSHTHTALRSVFAFLHSYSLLIFPRSPAVYRHSSLSLSGVYVMVVCLCVYAEMSFGVCVRWIINIPISCASMYTDYTEQYTHTGSLSFSVSMSLSHTLPVDTLLA